MLDIAGVIAAYDDLVARVMEVADALDGPEPDEGVPVRLRVDGESIVMEWVELERWDEPELVITTRSLPLAPLLMEPAAERLAWLDRQRMRLEREKAEAAQQWAAEARAEAEERERATLAQLKAKYEGSAK